MTELEKEKLFKLRVQGCDWEFISKELSVPENTLKSYCYRNGLTDNDIAKIRHCIVHRDDSVTFVFRDGAKIDIQPVGRTRRII